MRKASHWFVVALISCPLTSHHFAGAEERPRLTREPTPRMGQWGVKDFERMVDKLWFVGDRPTITVPAVSKSPSIDGKAEDACWGDATVVTKFVATKGFAASPPLRYGLDFSLGHSELRLCYDQKALYAYFKCYEEHMPLLQMTTDNRDGSTWKDDCLEFLFDPKLTREMAYHLIYNPVPALYDAKEAGSTREEGKVNEDRKWNWDGCEARVERAEDYWALEVALPFDAVGGGPKPGNVWGANFCRQRRATTQVAIWGYDTWSGIPHTFFGRPDMLGDLVFGEIAVDVPEMPEPFFGKAEWVVKLKNLSGKPRKVSADVRIASMTEARVSSPVSAELAPGEVTTIRVPYTVEFEDVQFAAVRVKDAAGKLIQVARRGFEIEPILPILDATLPRVKKIMAKSEDEAFRASIGEYRQKLEDVRQRVETFRKDAIANLMDLSKREGWLTLLKEARGLSSLSSYIVWTKSPWLATGPSDFPPLLSDLEALSVEAGVNEYESAVLMITNLTEDLLEVMVLGEPSGLKEVRAPLSATMQTVLEENPAALGLDDPRGFMRAGETGEPLPAMGEFRNLLIPPLSSRQIWLTFHTKGLKPGRHGGTLTVQPLNKAYEAKRVPVKLNVWDFEIPDQAELGVHCYDYSHPEDLPELAAHKVNHFFCADNGQFKIVNGKFVHDLEGAKRSTAEKIKFGKAAWAYGFCKAFHDWAVKQKLEPMGPEFVEYWKEAVRSLAEMHRELGLDYKDYSVGVWDEVKGRDVDTVVEMLKVLKEVEPNMRMANTICCSMEEKRKLAPYLEVWVQAGGALWGNDLEFYEEQRKEGDEIWAYKCSVPVKAQAPIGYYRCFGWRAEKFKLYGVSFFAWSYLIYRVNNKVVTTRPWEAYREGIEDNQYFRALHREAQACREAGLEDEAQQAEKLLTESIDELLGRSYHPTDSPETSELLYAKRRSVAEEIIRLKALLRKARK